MTRLILRIIFILLLSVSPAFAGWGNIDSTYYESACGYTTTYTPQNMLDGSGAWYHLVSETPHYLVIDLGTSQIVSKIKTKNIVVAGAGPDDITVYVSDDTGSWGAAVESNIDITGDSSVAWTERELTTKKSGRYIKLDINTVHASNYLGWGSAVTKVLDFYLGALPDRYTTFIPLLDQQYTTDQSTYVPTDGSLGMIPWDGSKYNNIVGAYLLISGYRTGSVGGDPSPSCYIQLYDRTNTAEIGSAYVTGTTTGTGISLDVSANLPAGAATFDVRVKQQDATTATATNAHLVIVQEITGSGDKTRVYIPVAGIKTYNSTTYSKLGSILASTVEKQYKYVSANFSTLSAAYFSATLKSSNASYTCSLKLDDTSGSSALATLTSTSTTPDLQTSADISGSLVNNTTYTSWIKSSTARQNVYVINGFLILDLTSPTKLQTCLQVANIGKSTTTTGWTEDDTQKVRYLTGNDYQYNVTEAVTHAAVVAHSGDTSMGASLYDDNVENSSARVSTTNETTTLQESSAITPADDSDMSLGYNLGSSGALISGTAYDSRLLITLTDIGSAATSVKDIIGQGVIPFAR